MSLFYLISLRSFASPVYFELVGLGGQHLVIWYDPELPAVINGALDTDWEVYSDTRFELSRLAGIGCTATENILTMSDQSDWGLRVGIADGREYSRIDLGDVAIGSEKLIGAWSTGDRLSAIERASGAADDQYMYELYVVGKYFDDPCKKML